MSHGWVTNHRKIKDWEWYKVPHMAHLFQHLIREANRSPKTWRGQRVERGQLITGRKTLSVETGISEQSIRTCMERLKSTNEITTKSTSQYTIITLCNYETYQDKPSPANQQLTSGSTSHLTNDQPADQPQTTSKQSKQVNKPPLVRFDYEKSTLTGLTDEDFEKWAEAFPAVNIGQEVKSAEQWLSDNPTKRKKAVRRFLTNWLRRQQERGGNKGRSQQGDSVSTISARLQAEGKIPNE